MTYLVLLFISILFGVLVISAWGTESSLSSCEQIQQFRKSVRFEEARDALLKAREEFDILYAESGSCPSEGYSNLLSTLNHTMGDLDDMGRKVDSVTVILRRMMHMDSTTPMCAKNALMYITRLRMWRNFMFSFGVAVTSPPCEKSLDDVPLFKEALGEIEPSADLSMCEEFIDCDLSD